MLRFQASLFLKCFYIFQILCDRYMYIAFDKRKILIDENNRNAFIKEVVWRSVFRTDGSDQR